MKRIKKIGLDSFLTVNTLINQDLIICQKILLRKLKTTQVNELPYSSSSSSSSLVLIILPVLLFLIISILFRIAESNEKIIHDSLTLKDLLPSGKKRFYTCEGSLTTPPCSETVTWIVIKCPITVSKTVYKISILIII